MIISMHVTHSSAGSNRIAHVIPEFEKGADEFLKRMPGMDGYVILRTCNRFEVYISSVNPEQARFALTEYARKKVQYDGDSVLWYILRGGECVKHLFRVTCGLDSLIVGEDQIQGQVKNSYLKAKEEGHVSKALALVFDKALYTGKRVRTETELNSGALSVGSAAVQLAERKMGALSGKKMAIIGAGDMATVIAKNLLDKRPEAIFVSNRTFGHACVLANEVGGKAVNFSEIVDVLTEADLAIVATNAPHVLIDREIMKKVVDRRTSRLLIIDISVPRNVSDDVSDMKGVEVDSMGDISALSQENLMNRRNEIVNAERIVESELKNMEYEIREKRADDVIGRIATRASEIRSEELSFARSRINAGVDVDEVLDDLSRALIAKLFSKPYERMKEASRNGCLDICDAASSLFGVDDNEVSRS